METWQLLRKFKIGHRGIEDKDIRRYGDIRDEEIFVFLSPYFYNLLIPLSYTWF